MNGRSVKRAVFYERGESRKNFSHAGGMKDSFDRQPPLYPSARQRGSSRAVVRAVAGSGSQTRPALCSSSSSHRHTLSADQCSI